jgi:hypothetical protein
MMSGAKAPSERRSARRRLPERVAFAHSRDPPVNDVELQATQHAREPFNR